jgi:hypothetical protein
MTSVRVSVLKCADQSDIVLISFYGADTDLLCCGHTVWYPSDVLTALWLSPPCRQFHQLCHPDITKEACP